MFGNEQSDCNRVIALAWKRLCLYMQMAWKKLVFQVRQDRLSLIEAKALMEAQYGSEGTIWTLHEITLQVAPVPPGPTDLGSLS